MKSFKTTKLPQIVVITEYFGENNNKILLSVAFEGLIAFGLSCQISCRMDNYFLPYKTFIIK